MGKFKLKRGLEANLGNTTLEDGELAITTDTHKLYVGLSGSKYCIGSASSLGDMLKSIYDTDNDGIVDQAEKVNWSGVQNKPPFITINSTAPSSPSAGDLWYKVL